MKISIFGLGYVGAVTAACLAKRGHSVIAVDCAKTVVESINAGRAPVVEPGLDELIREGVSKGLIRATADAGEAISKTELTLVCVATPSQADGSLDLSYLRDACATIGAQLAEKNGRHAVAVRSSVLPGTLEQVVVPALEAASGKQAGTDFGVASHPELLRESTAIKDFDQPTMTLIGALDNYSEMLLTTLYASLDAPIVRKTPAMIEMIKYATSAWQATKLSFANEMGSIAKDFGIDGREVMDVVCQDRKLNLSPYNLHPSCAFGGSGLPRDVRALAHAAGTMGAHHALLDALLVSQTQQAERARQLVEASHKRKVGLLGLAFKAGTDDLRESPLVDLAAQLLERGYDLKIHDPHVDYNRIGGANRAYIDARVPELGRLLQAEAQAVIAHADVIVIGNNDVSYGDALSQLAAGKHVIDLVGQHSVTGAPAYNGIGW